MAKDLPYFKFKVSEWNDGDIVLCSLEAQGLFTNLCSLYWSQEGKLSLSKMKRRFSDCKATAWKELISDSIIKVEGDAIIINFLDEQFIELSETSKKNSENAAKGWQKRRKKMPDNATPLPQTSDLITLASNKEEIRKEEIKEDKKRGEEDTLPFLGLDLSLEKLLKDELWIHNIQPLAKGKDLPGAARAAFLFLESKPYRFKTATIAELKSTTLSWLENQKHGTNGQPKEKAEDRFNRLRK